MYLTLNKLDKKFTDSVTGYRFTVCIDVKSCVKLRLKSWLNVYVTHCRTDVHLQEMSNEMQLQN